MGFWFVDHEQQRIAKHHDNVSNQKKLNEQNTTKTFPHMNIKRIVYEITCSPTTDVNCPITEAWYLTLGLAVQLQAWKAQSLTVLNSSCWTLI